MLHAVATSAATFAAVNVQHVELADQIREEKMIAPSRGINNIPNSDFGDGEKV
jgi:hypothetical protein